MSARSRAAYVAAAVALLGAATVTSVALAAVGPFAALASGFTQTLYAVSSAELGGSATAANGDTLVDECEFSGSPLHRFSSTSTDLQHGSPLHAESVQPSAAGCGISDHPDGTLYSNSSMGVQDLDASTAARLRTLGVPGNALGIAVDPQTNHLVYVGADCRFTATCTIVDVDPVSGAMRTFAQLTSADAQLVDALVFDRTGNFVLLANRGPLFRLTVLSRSGLLVQQVALPSQPDGVAIQEWAVVTNNTDGTLTRLDFPNGDFAAAPTLSVLASGGFRGDLMSVGADGCLFVTQGDTRFGDGTLSAQHSVVQVCAVATHTPTPTQTATPTSTSSPMATATATATLTPTPKPTDTTAPSCVLSGISLDSQNRKVLQITLQDAQSGLASVTVTTLTNASANVGTYQTGITVAPATVTIGDHTVNPVVVSVTRLNQTLSVQVALRVVDVAGNGVSCDPIVTTIDRDQGSPKREVFHHVARDESLITVYNDTPGLTSLAVIVDGRRRELKKLDDGEVRTVDVSDLMRRGDNTVTLETQGKRGGSATVLVWGN